MLLERDGSKSNHTLNILEEYTRFGGGQVFSKEIYGALWTHFSEVNIVTDSNHVHIPDSMKKANILESHLSDVDWSHPARAFRHIVPLKHELSRIVPEGFTVNNHPNVFIYNGSINMAYEFFGFLAHRPRKLDRVLVRGLRLLRLFDVYDNGYFLVQGEFTRKQTIETFRMLDIRNPSIRVIPSPVEQPSEVSLEDKVHQILTFGRISMDKQIETVLSIARELPSERFIVAGSVLEQDVKYMCQLKKDAPSNVYFYENPDSKLKDKLFRESKVYLHTKKNENFGLSVAEAVSYGLIPVVPKDGGPWEDILNYGEFGYSYIDTSGAIEALIIALGASLGEAERIYGSRERFSRERFRKSFCDIIEGLI